MIDFFSRNFYRFCFLIIVLPFFITACGSAPKVDLRTLAPRDSLVYLETKDVKAALDALTSSPSFQTLADKKDFSALENTQLAIAVTGFETSEKDSVLNLKPRFVAVADTRLWNWQAISLIENQLDAFIKKSYGANAKFGKSEKDNGNFYVWTADDARKVFAFVQENLIFFSNDADAIEKSLAVKKGAGENLTQNESFQKAYSENNLTFGYVSTGGIKEIAALAGVSVAVNASDEADARNFIARILPQLLQNTTEEIVWTANRANGGIEDKYSIKLKPETNAVLKEILISETNAPFDFAEFLPSEIFSATRYNLKNPSIAWRDSIRLTAQNSDELSGKILKNFSGKLLEPYGIGDAENFTASVSAPIVTAQFDSVGEKSVTLATVKDSTRLKDSLSKEINFKSPPEMRLNAEIWFSEDKNLAAGFVENKIVLGDGESVLKCLAARQKAGKFLNFQSFQRFADSKSASATFGTDADSAEKIVNLLGNPKVENRRLATFYTTETRLTETGFERVTNSDFGFIGTILKNLD